MSASRAVFALFLFALTLTVGRPSARASTATPRPRARPTVAVDHPADLAELTRRDDAMAYAIGAPPPPPPPAWVCPVQGPVEFVDSWGAPRSGGRRHKGVDMMSAQGTPVIAPVSGVVTLRGSRVGGLSFHLDGDDGVYYYGTHLSAYGAEGVVAAGTVIGYVGSTGNARGKPHLHFEIHPGGQGNAVNPHPTVAQYC